MSSKVKAPGHLQSWSRLASSAVAGGLDGLSRWRRRWTPARWWDLAAGELIRGGSRHHVCLHVSVFCALPFCEGLSPAWNSPTPPKFSLSLSVPAPKVFELFICRQRNVNFSSLPQKPTIASAAILELTHFSNRCAWFAMTGGCRAGRNRFIACSYICPQHLASS